MALGLVGGSYGVFFGTKAPGGGAEWGAPAVMRQPPGPHGTRSGRSRRQTVSETTISAAPATRVVGQAHAPPSDGTGKAGRTVPGADGSLQLVGGREAGARRQERGGGQDGPRPARAERG